MQLAVLLVYILGIVIPHCIYICNAALKEIMHSKKLKETNQFCKLMLTSGIHPSVEIIAIMLSMLPGIIICS